MCVWRGGKGEGEGGEGVALRVVRPNRAAPHLAVRGDPSPRGCPPPYATRAGGSQPAARGGRGSGAVGRGLRSLFILLSPKSVAAFALFQSTVIGARFGMTFTPYLQSTLLLFYFVRSVRKLPDTTLRLTGLPLQGRTYNTRVPAARASLVACSQTG